MCLTLCQALCMSSLSSCSEPIHGLGTERLRTNPMSQQVHFQSEKQILSCCLLALLGISLHISPPSGALLLAISRKMKAASCVPKGSNVFCSVPFPHMEPRQAGLGCLVCSLSPRATMGGYSFPWFYCLRFHNLFFCVLFVWRPHPVMLKSYS